MIPLQVRKLSGRFLVVDDEYTNVRMLRRMLETAGASDVLATTDPQEVVEICEKARPDIVLLDLNMPQLDGTTLLGHLNDRFPDRAAMPIIVLTADAMPEAKHRALEAGATDFLTKPFDALELVLRIGNHLQMRQLHLKVLESNELLESRVRERTQDLECAQAEIIERLSVATERRDDQTGGHVQRVSELTGWIAETLGTSPGEVETLRKASLLHDIGKISVPDSVLLKKGALSPTEYQVMREHTTMGGKILEGSRFPFIVRAEEIARSHHERWDGAGYPEGLMGETIPLSARIVAVADVFDALTHDRPYKRAWCPQAARSEISRQSGSQFDPRVVEAFEKVVAERPALNEVPVACAVRCTCRSDEHESAREPSINASPAPERHLGRLERIVTVLKAA